MKILILGGGWYGCMIALICKSNNLDFLILDENEIFSGSSSKNQNRLHLGYHYPRSPETIKECKEGYLLFNNIFGEFTKNIKNNIYAIEKNSKVNFKEYINIFNIHNDRILSKQILDKNNLKINDKLIEKQFTCDEKRINHMALKKKFNNLFNSNFKKLDKSKLFIDDENIIYDNIKYDFFCNCTYGQSRIGFEEVKLECFYELCLTFLYKLNSNNNDFSFTIMDGNYLSLYSYENEENLYTLTHVKHTPIYVNDNLESIIENKKNIDIEFINQKKNLFENDISKYLLNFKENFSYYDYYLSIKCKFNSSKNSDDRSLKYFEKNNKLLFIGGKITGIFEMSNIFVKKLNINFDIDKIKLYL